MFGLDTASALSIIGGIVALLSFASVILAGVFVSSKSKGTKDALESLGATNASMQVALDFERAERIRDKEECAREVAHLTGQIDAMQKHQVDALMHRVGQAMDTTVTTMLDRLEDGLQAAVTTAVTQGVEAGVRAAHE